MNGKMTNSNLLFRRQFLISSEHCSNFIQWKHIQFGKYHLYSHPELEVTKVISNDKKTTIILIGYIIDPYYPKHSNKNVLDGIAKFANSLDRISVFLESLSGRFVLIIKRQEDTWLFHDPCGLRTVYYTEYDGNLLIASQPNIFKKIIPLKEGERFFSYLRSSYVKTNKEHWIPSGCSLFEKIFHLIPNHFLKFSTRRQIRYWPRKNFSQKTPKEVVIKASDLLQKLMIAANNRFSLALPLTAGWDSRVLLSTLNTIANEVYFYTLQYRDINSKSNDIKIPQQLLHSLGLSHNVIKCRKIVNKSFQDVYSQNASPVHMNDWGEIAYAMIDEFPKERICLKGNCAEITRCYYYKYGKHQKITSADQIIELVDGWEEIPFIKKQISNWFNQAQEVSKKVNMDILDLFYWEHTMGSWQAQSQLEWNIVQEVFTPFNNRELLEELLSVPAKFRNAPNYKLFRMMINYMWPEIMIQPINPKTTKESLEDILGILGLEETVSKIYKYIFK